MTCNGALVSIAREYQSGEPSHTLRARMLAHFAGDPASELADIVIVRDAADVARIDMPPYAKLLLGWLHGDERV